MIKAIMVDVDGVYYSAALGCKKPNRAFFNQVAALSGFAAEKLLLLDDTPASIIAAKELGWKAIEW